MPIAAVPKYLGADFKGASPGMRFGMYLKLWGQNRRTQTLLWKTHDVGYEVRGQQRQEREVQYDNKAAALSEAKTLCKADRDTMQALLARQSRLGQTVPGACFRLDAQAVAPFTTGLGNEHPLENGFSFLWPYGLPYLPGSGVKGVLRKAAQELAAGLWGGNGGWSALPGYKINGGTERNPQWLALSMIDVLFGREPPPGDGDHVRGALSFWDVIPQIAGDSLMVEIMTPHQSHYYQKKQEKRSGDSVSPHDSGQPNPISFLTVPPGSAFAFHVVCDDSRLARLTAHRQPDAPDLRQEDANGKALWQALVGAAFEHAFQWLGFGAKTAVGYGAMQRDAAAEAKAFEAARKRAEEEQRRREAAEREARRALLSENMRRIEDFKAEFAARAEELRGGREKPNAAYHDKARKLAKDAQEADGWTAEEKRAVAEAIEEWLPKVVKVEMKDERKKLKLAALKGQA